MFGIRGIIIRAGSRVVFYIGDRVVLRVVPHLIVVGRLIL
jgi:hypothetical protein